MTFARSTLENLCRRLWTCWYAGTDLLAALPVHPIDKPLQSAGILEQEIDHFSIFFWLFRDDMDIWTSLRPPRACAHTGRFPGYSVSISVTRAAVKSWSMVINHHHSLTSTSHALKPRVIQPWQPATTTIIPDHLSTLFDYWPSFIINHHSLAIINHFLTMPSFTMVFNHPSPSLRAGLYQPLPLFEAPEQIPLLARNAAENSPDGLDLQVGKNCQCCLTRVI